MCLSLPALAQNNFDPFAPNVVAPSEPTAVPTAPKPVAPKLPPRPVPVEPVAAPQPIKAPDPIVEAAPKPASTPQTQIISPPTSSIETVSPASKGEAEPSFFEKLGNLFESKETEEKTVESTQETENKEPVKEPKEHVSDELPHKTPSTEPETVAIQAPALTTEPQSEKIVQTTPVYQAPADPSNKAPFAPSSVAPALPTGTPTAPATPVIVVHEPKPKTIVDEFIRPVVEEKTPEPIKEPEIEQVEPVQEMVEIEKTEEPSFFDKLGNLFKTEEAAPTEKAILVEDIEIPAETVIEPVELEAPLKPVKPIETTKITEAPTPVTKDEKGFFERLFGTNEQPYTKETIKQALKPAEEPTGKVEAATTEPAPKTEATVQPITTAEITPTETPISSEPFAPNAVAPSAPTNTPTVPEPIAQIETVSPTTKNKSTQGLLDKLTSPSKSNEKPATEKHKASVVSTPETARVKNKPEIQQETVVAKAEPEGPGFFERIGSFFKDTFERQEETVAEPIAEKKKESTPAKEDTPQPSPATQTEAPQPKPAPKPMDPRLAKAQLGLGKNIKLGQTGDDLSSKAKCFTKNRGTVAYCLTPTSWPSSISGHFDVSSHLYKGTQGIVQYDGDIATRLFSLFNEKGFEEIIAYYEQKFGPASNVFIRKTRTIRQGMVNNPTYVWHKENLEDGLIEIMEIRKIADTRGSIPDTRRGSIRVYFEGAREIFSLTSDLDYMDLR